VDIPQTSSKLDYEKLQQIIVQKQEEVSELQRQLSTTSIMSYDMLRTNDELLAHYIGLPNNAMYECLLQFCERFSFSVTTWAVSSVSVENQLLITLMKLRHNFTHKHQAFLFHVSLAAITNITAKWIDILHELLFIGILKNCGIPSRHKNLVDIPHVLSPFKEPT